MIVKLNNVRLAFAQVFEAKTVNGEGEPAFSAAFLFPKTHPAYAEMEKAILATAKDKWGDKAIGILKDMKARDKTALHDGDLKSEYDGYPGNYFVNARNKKRPTIVDRSKKPLVAADGIPYSGCYVNAQVDLWGQDNKYGKRVNATLLGIQFVKDGEAFSGAASISADDFEDVEETSDEGEGAGLVD